MRSTLVVSSQNISCCYDRVRYRCVAVKSIWDWSRIVVKISSDIVTEHCCQVCVLSMMFCRSDCRLCADRVSCWIAVERSKMRSISIHIIANQSSYHDDKSTLQCFICVFCPQLIRNVRSRRRIDSSSIIAHPVNSDAHLGEIVKMLSQELDIYIYIALDNLYGFFYQFNLGFSQFLLMKSLNFFF